MKEGRGLSPRLFTMTMILIMAKCTCGTCEGNAFVIGEHTDLETARQACEVIAAQQAMDGKPISNFAVIDMKTGLVNATTPVTGDEIKDALCEYFGFDRAEIDRQAQGLEKLPTVVQDAFYQAHTVGRA